MEFGVKLQAQARICPLCIDDHAENVDCSAKDLMGHVIILKNELSKANIALDFAISELQGCKKASQTDNFNECKIILRGMKYENVFELLKNHIIFLRKYGKNDPIE